MTSPSSQTSPSPAESTSPTNHLVEPSGAPIANGAPSATGAPGSQRKRLPGAQGAAKPAAGGAQSGAQADAPKPPQVYVLVVVNDDGYIEVCIEGENCKSKLVERRPFTTDEQFQRQLGWGWKDLYDGTRRRHTSIVFPPLKRIEDLVGEIWEARRRWGYLSLSTVASLASMSRICGATVPELLERLVESPAETGTAFAKSSLSQRAST
jgi:hypothetical protein